ncbi:hypothetical protein NRS6120_01120 [Bacillus subtilis]|nr:hypothetical protein NRS6120_04229 [Bacillus subtilis]CAI6222537.1 hypothetical protein NRS6120_01120 [Bacillus subtilis]
MFALLKYPSMFGKIGSISGSYWYENVAETIHISSLKPGTARVFMSVGSEEGREKQSIQRHMLKKTKQVHQSLKEKGFTEDQLCLSIEKGAVHHRKYFCKQFINALEWLYEKNRSTLGLTPVFETGIKTPFKQPIADNLSVIGCLVSFEYEYCYNNECIL